jgi:hypothetical protein
MNFIVVETGLRPVSTTFFENCFNFMAIEPDNSNFNGNGRF